MSDLYFPAAVGSDRAPAGQYGGRKHLASALLDTPPQTHTHLADSPTQPHVIRTTSMFSSHGQVIKLSVLRIDYTYVVPLFAVSGL